VESLFEIDEGTATFSFPCVCLIRARQFFLVFTAVPVFRCLHRLLDTFPLPA
jgi:hypothetical protein